MRKAGLLVVSIASCLVLVAACFFSFHVHSKLNGIRREVQADGVVAFDSISLPSAGSNRVGPVFTPLLAADSYTAGALLEGSFYLAGPGGLVVYDETGRESGRLHTGTDLPGAPIMAAAVGRLRGDSAESLVLGTRGEGLLILHPGLTGGIQILPRESTAREITAVLPLASGEVLLGTRGAGILRYDGKELKQFLPVIRDAVTAMAGSDADLWVGTQAGDMLHWQGGQLARLGMEAGLPDAQVLSITTRPDAVFAGTPLGVAEFREGRLARVLGKGTFARALAVEGDTLLAATMDQGVREFPLGQSELRRIGIRDGGPELSGFVPSRDGVFGLARDGGLLQHESGGGWQKVISPTAAMLADRNVAALEFAPDGRLWVGYFDRGLDVVDTATGRADHVEDDHVFCVNRIVQDRRRQTMDVATANGLVLFDGASARPRVRQVLSRRDGLISDQVTDVAFSRWGTVVGTPAGITFLTASGAQSIYAFHGLASNHVYSLATDPEETRVLAGTLGGISVVDDGAVLQNVTLRNSGLKRNWITALVKVSEAGEPDSWLVGTYGGGVMQMDVAGHLVAMDSGAPEAVINPNAMLVTAAHVFAGTLADGLLIYDRGSGRWSRITSGLPSRNVTALAVRDGEVYVGTDNGVVHVAERNLP